MTAQRYVPDILQPFVLPQCNGSQEPIFNTARGSQGCLRTITTLPWPSQFPDLSPIEYIWDHLGWRVGYPTSLNELETRLRKILEEMSQDIIHNLYVSMPDRIASCIREIGCSIVY
ncbi:transposable element Tcb1 transposase [Trichonephila clavipes]|nr:transposable element Tcb1 transposase [Trichonephila clavipes]